MEFPGAITCTSAPAVEPLSVAETKTFLRVDHSDEDTLIGYMIKTAREVCERFTNRQLITATYTLKLNAFPGGDGRLYFSRSPLQSITSIQYYDENAVSQTLSSALYQVNIADIFGSAIPIYTESWPTTEAGKENAITITFKSGYGDAATNVPESLRLGMQMYIAHLYEFREAATGPSETIHELWASQCAPLAF